MPAMTSLSCSTRRTLCGPASPPLSVARGSLIAGSRWVLRSNITAPEILVAVAVLCHLVPTDGRIQRSIVRLFTEELRKE
jgi:hypothetical protein